MAQDPEIPARELNTEDVAAVAPPPRRGFMRRHWGKVGLLTFIGIPAALLVVWSLVALNFTYSSGNRVGFVQKISRKGWVCKTWEGELQMSNIPGSAPQLFAFTVRSDSVAAAMEAVLGKQVELTYQEHKGVPLSCFGETSYFIVGVRSLGG